MEPKFIRIDDNLLINLAHVIGVWFHGRRTDDRAARLYADVYTISGTYSCFEPYIASLKMAIADMTVGR